MEPTYQDPRRYLLRYDLKVERGPFTREQIDKGRGGADAFILGSILLTDGLPDVKWFSRDGRSEAYAPIPGELMFGAWHALAVTLATHPGVPPELQSIARASVEAAHLAWRVR